MNNIIHLYFYDKDFVILDVIKDFSSLRWVTKWFDVGLFEIHVDSKHLKLFQTAVYIGRKDSNYVGMIEDFSFDVGSTTDIYVVGRMLEMKLDERVVNYSATYSGNAETVMRSIVSEFCINPVDVGRKIPKLVLGKYNGLGRQIRVTPLGKSVLVAIQEIALEQKLSFNMRYEFLEDVIYFDVLESLDRSQDQDINSWCVFSTSFKNVIREKYTVNKFIKNFAFVEGSGVGEERIGTIVDVSNGGERKEKYVDAKHLQQGTQTLATYLEVLKTWGLQKLAEFGIIETIELEIDSSRFIITNDKEIKASLPIFGLGDITTYSNSTIDFVADAPVVELEEIIEGTNISTRVVLGREALDIKKKIQRGELTRD